MTSQKYDISLVFLQGLGNSIINFPIYYQLSKKYKVKVITFNNGSSSFYRAFGADVEGIRSIKDIYFQCKSINTEMAFSCFPNWRRELLALNSVNSAQRYHFDSKKYLSPFFLGQKLPSVQKKHDLENNFEILKFLKIEHNSSLDYSKELGLTPGNGRKSVVIHPTASTVFKYYPTDFWKSLIGYLRKNFDEIKIICGSGHQEIQFCQSLMSDKCSIHSGLDFYSLSSLIANSELFIGLDSSMMHLASLLKRKVIALWSFADFHRIYPFSQDTTIYLPDEVINSKNFLYPKEELFWLKRANHESIIEIIEGRNSSAQSMLDSCGNHLKIITY